MPNNSGFRIRFKEGLIFIENPFCKVVKTLGRKWSNIHPLKLLNTISEIQSTTSLDGLKNLG